MGMIDDAKKRAEAKVNLGAIYDALAEAKRLIKHLDSLTGVVPRARKYTHPGPGPPEDIYADLWDTRRKVEELIERLENYKGAIGSEMASCNNRLRDVSSDADQINSEAVKHGYSDAQQRLIMRLKELRKARALVARTIKIAYEAVCAAMARQAFPGGVPRQWPGMPDHTVLKPGDPVFVNPWPPNPDLEIDRLFLLDEEREFKPPPTGQETNHDRK